MPKHLTEYGFHDFLRLRPFVHRLKTMRYRRIDRRFARRPAVAGDEAGVREAITGRSVIVTVAFNDPEILDWHTRLVRRFVEVDSHLIADNSPDGRTAKLMRRVAEEAGCLYLHLPPNLWSGRDGSRSHGLALNWVWHRILKPGQPRAFGLVDADIFPTVASHPFLALGEHAFYGDKRYAGDRWFLWAGYCFFRFDAVADKPLDFGQDWFAGLDTGGGNWEVLYRHVDPASLPDRPIRAVAALTDVDERDAYFEWRGDWLHEVGAGGDTRLKPRKRAALRKIMPSLIEGDRCDGGRRQGHAGS